MKTNKFDVDWQMTRLYCKETKNVQVKLSLAKSFLINNPTSINKDRVLNWLDGLAISYRDDRRSVVEHAKSSFLSIQVKEDSSPESLDFSRYSTKDIKRLATDLRKRNAVWLANGYVHKQQNAFLLAIYTYLEDTKSYMDLRSSMILAGLKKNEYKFLF